jgi:hypothetical protein
MEPPVYGIAVRRSGDERRRESRRADEGRRSPQARVLVEGHGEDLRFPRLADDLALP